MNSRLKHFNISFAIIVIPNITRPPAIARIYEIEKVNVVFRFNEN